MSNFHIALLCLSFISVSSNSEDFSVRQRRRTNYQPPEGKCMSYKWGGVSRWHWYNCCNNCINGSPTGVQCDGETYQSASSISYCNSCGVDNSKGNGDPRDSYFGCGGCSGQATIKRKCSTWWSKIPGFCWAFTMCFKSNCQKSYRGRRSTRDVDSVCNNNMICESGETPENCPTDCCYKNNPDRCTWKDNCLDECCGTSTCCLTSSGPSMGIRILLITVCVTMSLHAGVI